MEKVYRVKDLSQLDEVAKDVLSVFSSGRVFALEGQMGAGKTTFTKSLCKALDCKDNVCSPTFAIVNVLPEPVTPRSVWYFLPLFIPLTK